jgi:hypothetical protein
MVFGNLGKMAEMLKQAKMLKDEMSRARFEEERGGVKVIVNGEMEIIELKIMPNTSESAVKDTVNRALHKAKAEAAKLMQRLTGGMNIPGLT